MLSDSITLVPGASINLRISSGTAFPTQADNTLFFLTQATVGYQIGLYMKRNGVWTFITSKIGLTADSDFYVNASSGNDSNDGLTAGTAFKTIQHAVNVLKSRYDLRGFAATIKLAAGTYDENIVFESIPSGVVVLDGPTTAIIRNTVEDGICVTAKDSILLTVKGITFSTTQSGATALKSVNSWLCLDGGHVFTAFAAGVHLQSSYRGSIQLRGNYSVTGGATSHFLATDGSIIAYNPLGASIVTTLTGTPAFTQFVNVSRSAILNAGDYPLSFSGAATGLRYSVSLAGAIWVASKGANLFPGNAAGVAASGGVYSS